MNKLAIITAFGGGIKNRYISYQEDRSLEEKFAIAERIEHLDGLELCYPADAGQVPLLKKSLEDSGFGVSSINVRSRRTRRERQGREVGLKVE